MPSKTVFVAYNDSAQYLVFAEDYNPEQTRASLAQMRTVMAQKCEREAFEIEYDEGYACSGEEQSFYIRHLLSIALRRLSESGMEEPEKPTEVQKQEEAATQQPETVTTQEIESEMAEEAADEPEEPEKVEEETDEPETVVEEAIEQTKEPETVEEAAEQPKEEPKTAEETKAPDNEQEKQWYKSFKAPKEKTTKVKKKKKKK